MIFKYVNLFKQGSKTYLKAETLDIEDPPSIAPFSSWAVMAGTIFLAELVIAIKYGLFDPHLSLHDPNLSIILIPALGTALFIGEVFNLIFKVLFIKKATLAQGKVLYMVKFSRVKGARFKPLIRFQTLEGKTIQTYTRVYRNFGSYEVGQEVDVYYSPKDPKCTLIKNFTEQWFLIMYWGLWGLFLWIGPLLYSLYAIKK